MLINSERWVKSSIANQKNDERTAGLLAKILRLNTTIAVFDSGSDADFLMTATLNEKDVNGVWLWRQSYVPKLIGEWRHRPLAMRLTGSRMQERVFARVVWELMKHNSVVVIHARSGFDWRSAASGADHLIHLGSWTFDIVR